MKNRKLVMAAAIAVMVAGSACAEFVGSLLHQPQTGTVQNVFYWSDLTRITNGNVETRGTVEGTVQWQACLELDATNAADGWPSNYKGMIIKAFGESSQYQRLSRFEGLHENGVVVWDFDFSGIEEDFWALKYVMTRGGAANQGGRPQLQFYISYNGDGITLDESDISAQAPGTVSDYVDDTTLYRKVSYTPYAQTILFTETIDVTEHMQQAVANGGKVRLVLRDATYLDVITLFEDSGFHATNVNIGVVGGDYRVLTHFDETSGTLPIAYNSSPYGSWSGSGPEAKEYNLSSSGVLDIRDADADEGGGGEHGGLLDSVTFAIPGGIAMTNYPDVVQLDLSYGIYPDTSGASISTNPAVKISLTDSTAPSNSGVGWILWPKIVSGTEVVNGAAYSFDSPTVEKDRLSAAQETMVVQPFDGTMRRLQMRVTKDPLVNKVILTMYMLDSTDWSIGTGNGEVRGLKKVSWDIDVEVFDTLTISMPSADMGLKIDDLALFTSRANPEFTPYEVWIKKYPSVGGDEGYTDDPDADGFDNLHEWALGGNPTNDADIGYLSTYGNAGTAFYYTYPSNTLADDVLYTLEVSDNLTVPSAWTTGSYEVASTADLPNPNFVTVSNEVSTVGEPEQFIRLTIEEK